MRYRYLMSGSPVLRVDSATEINIFFDSSGSMDSSLVPLQQARDTLLANLLVPFYDNDLAQYNKRVSFIERSDESSLQWAQTLGSSNNITKVINILFTDENSPYDQMTTLGGQLLTDLSNLRNTIAGTPNDAYYRMVFFAVNGDEEFQTNVQKLFAGQSPFESLNLADYVTDEKVRLVHGVANGNTAEYYAGQIIDSINNLGYSLDNPY